MAMLLPGQLASGGFTPAKKMNDMASPTQMTKPNSESRYTAASRPMPSSRSLRKLLITPIVKKVMTKKIPRKAFASPMAARSLGARSADAPSARTNHCERQDVSQDELGKALPDFASARLV